ncbi:TATA element modulatory factor 1 TATA binding-domain-containing protein [Lipomyces japonicus]|uniref:TATA element modulatory factor 1 TATA binding-domain-containing protein n=1 Tax=Lipomyces japonicus TaxID=56871 RepID=UPI0034CEA4AF
MATDVDTAPKSPSSSSSSSPVSVDPPADSVAVPGAAHAAPTTQVIDTTTTVPDTSASTVQWGSFIKRAMSTVEQSLDKVLDPTMATDFHSTIPAVDKSSGQRISMQQRLALAMQGQKSSSSSGKKPSSTESSARQSIDSSDQGWGPVEIEPVTPVSNPASDQLTESAYEAAAEPVVEPIAEFIPADLDNDTNANAELVQKRADLHAALDRVTVLEEKVKYLSNQLLDYTQNKLGPIKIDKVLMEKDEKIALLLQEGETLSKTELKNMNTIKRLRNAERDAERRIQDALRRSERSDKEANDLRERLRKANEIERKQSDRIKLLAKSDAEVDILKRERDLMKTTISSLKDEVAQANTVAEDAIQKAQSNAVEIERKRADELEKEISKLKSEAALEAEKASQEKFNLESKLSRDNDRSKTREQELQNEISSLEHKIEALRTQTEELSARASGDSQAKLLRQVETLQAQYSIATENWKGIEASLLSRIANSESEREDIGKRDTASRKKLHDATVRIRELESELESSTSQINDLNSELVIKQDLVQSLRSRIDDESKRSSQIIKDLEKDRADFEQKLLEEEKARKEITSLGLRSQPSSPTLSMRQAFSNSENGLHSPNYLTLNVNNFNNGARSWSRNSSTSELQSLIGSQGSVPTSIQHRRASSRQPSHKGLTPYSPTISAALSLSSHSSLSSLYDADGSSSHINLHNVALTGQQNSVSSLDSDHDDRVSDASTAIGGGASSSERMSTVIHRLSSELSSAKEELAILMRDRDQAREEIVELLRESKEYKTTKAECDELRAKVEELALREQTTLELLGEKTERVNELQDDVQDLKTMYRQQIQELIEQIHK